MIKKVAAIYARVSTAKQEKRESSLPHQIRLMREYCKINGFIIADEYQETNSAWSERERPVFRKMINTARMKQKPYNAIVTLSPDRFSRNVERALFYKKELKRHGVEVVYCQGGVSTDNNPYGVIIELVQAGISQVHSDLLSIRVFTSMLENARQGYYNGGIKPKFGFMTVDAGKIGDRKKCKLALCHEEVEIIKSIYSWYLSGMGAKGITNRLNEDGCSYRGAKWAVSKVLEVLGEESYKGTYIYNQRDKKRKLKPREEWIHIPVEIIIDNETWDKVQYLKESRSPKMINPAIVASNSLLTGIAYCGLCNGRMVLESAKSGQYSYYQCRNFRMKGRSVCRGQRIPAQQMEDCIIEYLTDDLFSPPELIKMLKETYHTVKETQEQDDRLKSTLSKERRVNCRKIDKLLEVITDSKGVLNYEDFADKLRELKNRNLEIDVSLKSMNNCRLYSPEMFNHDEYLQFQLMMSSLFAQSDPATKKRALKSIVDKIVINYPSALISTKAGTVASYINDKHVGELPDDAASWNPSVLTTRDEWWADACSDMNVKSSIFL